MHTQILPYKNNSADLFDHFAHLPHAVFLDSCLPQQDQGRYDIISAMPIKIIDESGDVFEEIQNGLQQAHLLARALPSLLTKRGDNEFNATLNELAASGAPLPASAHSPFTIGAIGYLGYDIGRRLEVIPSIADDDIALPKAYIGIYDWSIVVDHHEKKTTLHAINIEKANQILKLLNTKPESFEPFALSKPFESNMSKTVYQQAFDEIKKNIISGNCYQVNLAQRFSAQFLGSSWSAYKTLREKNPAPYSAFISFCSNNTLPQRQTSLNTLQSQKPACSERSSQTRASHSNTITTPLFDSLRESTRRLPKLQCAPRCLSTNKQNYAILSCSPERFLKIENNIVETKPIKGTSKRFTDPTQDQQSATELLNSEKDRAENVMIVDLLRNDLSRTCTDVTVQQLCALERFSNVHHLVSTITGKLSANTSAIDVFKHCFPGGSITGAPKIAAMKIIESLEPHRRSVYCGSIFYADINGNFDSNIVIRTAICDDNKIHCYGGGGRVYHSQCDQEYAEIQAKIGRMIATLDSVNNIVTK